MHDRDPVRYVEVDQLGVDKSARAWTRALHAAIEPGVIVAAEDAAQRSATLDAHGARTMVGAVDVESNRVRITASIGWLPLGIDLIASSPPRGPSGTGVRAQFSVTAREEHQAAALLGPDVRQALDAFDGFPFKDMGATVVDVVPATFADLERRLVAIVRLQRVMSDARKRLPPPTAFRDREAMFKAFAERHEGDWTPGDMSLRMRMGSTPITLHHVFEGKTPRRSVLTAALPREFAVAPSAGKMLAFNESLSSSLGHDVTLTDAGLALALPVVFDPLDLEPLLRPLADAVERLAAKAATPYR
jgi:hypothetical protein